MDDTDVFAWKNERPCRYGCNRTATIGYETCAPCRVLRGATVLPEATRAVLAELEEKLTEAAALPIERAINEIVEARGRATLCVALLAGLKTRTVRDGDGVRCEINPGDAHAS